MEIILWIISAIAVSVALRFALFDDEYNFRLGKKQSMDNDPDQPAVVKISKLERTLNSSDLGIDYKKFKRIKIGAGLTLGVVLSFLTGWIGGFLPGFLIGWKLPDLLLNRPIKAKKSRWEEQILFFTQNMVQSLPYSGSISGAIMESIKTIEDPFKGAVLNIMMDYNNNVKSIESGFMTLSESTNMKSLKLISDAIATSKGIGIDAATKSFEQLYDILVTERTNKMKRETELKPFSVFVKVFMAAAFFTPLVQMILISDIYNNAIDNWSGRIATTAGYMLVWLVIVIMGRVESTEDIEGVNK